MCIHASLPADLPGFAPRPTRLDFGGNDATSSSTAPGAVSASSSSEHVPYGHSQTHGYHGHYGGQRNDNEPPQHRTPSARHSSQKGPAPPIPKISDWAPPSAGANTARPVPMPRTSTVNSGSNNNSNSVNNNLEELTNTSRVVVNSNDQMVGAASHAHGLPTASVHTHSSEPVCELEKKGHTSVIRVSYPMPVTPTEPVVTFPSEEPANAASASVAPIPPTRTNRSGSGGTTLQFPASAMTRLTSSDSQMGLDNFKFCTVLGRGHFGKVNETSPSQF